jgi:hypothetical protein
MAKSLKSSAKFVAGRVTKALKSDAAKVNADAKATAKANAAPARPIAPRTPPPAKPLSKAASTKAAKAATKDAKTQADRLARDRATNPPGSALPPGHSNAAAVAAERNPSKAVRNQPIDMPTLPSKTALDVPVTGQFGDPLNPPTDVHGNPHGGPGAARSRG